MKEGSSERRKKIERGRTLQRVNEDEGERERESRFVKKKNSEDFVQTVLVRKEETRVKNDFFLQSCG